MSSLHAHHGHGHHHEAHDHDHGHEAPREGRGLWMSLAMTAAFAVIEAGTGLMAHSLALLSDAGHMLSDTLALALSLFAVWMGRRPPSARHSYGFARTEIIVAFVNGLVLLAVVTAIVIAAVRRLQHPEAVAGGAVMAVAALGILMNGGVVYALSRERHTLNTRSAILHVLGDLLGSAAALVAGAVVYFTGWDPIDPILSLVISYIAARYLDALRFHCHANITRRIMPGDHVMAHGDMDILSRSAYYSPPADVPRISRPTLKNRDKCSGSP